MLWEGLSDFGESAFLRMSACLYSMLILARPLVQPLLCPTMTTSKLTIPALVCSQHTLLFYMVKHLWLEPQNLLIHRS